MIPVVGPAIRDGPHGLLIGGEWVAAPAQAPVVDKFTGEAVAWVAQAGEDHVRAAVDAAHRAFQDGAIPPRERFGILSRTAEAVATRREEIARIMIAETGFTWRDVRTDIARAVQTLQLSAEEAKRLGGEVLPIQAAPGFERALAFTLRVPLGVVAAITPFNSPLNTVCHKIAPALAAGNSVVLKPATPTPLSALWLAERLLEAGLPPGWLNVLTGPGGSLGRWLVEDPRVRFVTFTGSTAVGREIQARIGLRRSCMELGNVSATIVCADAELDRAVPLVTAGAFRKAGQVCTSVQRLYVEQPVYDELVDRLAAAARALRVGNPWDEATDVGPMISESKAAEAQAWVEEAAAAGAQVVTGGRRQGTLLDPTVLVDVPPDARVVCDEIFAPVVSVVPCQSFDEAVERVNEGPYGLQAGVFTRDLRKALTAARRLAVGGVIVNGSSSTRADLMPYGGTKQSGFGREGPRYAIEELTEVRTVVFYE
ncbi:MAG: aldehyde dehydrogenase family protein [Armatimonadota bacterium]|nr:aldehyde dehydrogenase family protein [Armatimonadota bacterium]MDR7452498.1 aldehyde dehydrogenase family protein [Armatimonadota bacterium]